VCFIFSPEAIINKGYLKMKGIRLFLGTKEFVEQMDDRFKVKNIRLKRGRPREEDNRIEK